MVVPIGGSGLGWIKI